MAYHMSGNTPQYATTYEDRDELGSISIENAGLETHKSNSVKKREGKKSGKGKKQRKSRHIGLKIAICIFGGHVSGSFLSITDSFLFLSVCDCGPANRTVISFDAKHCQNGYLRSINWVFFPIKER
ncbi:hypothetical protein CEXT_44541 [Caerostris extrusa]|uniref:Uncharacterized protein n=1 Tax=Caerostris extrusa TaxID=172846 RepID=A0AAV4Y3B0_CAEEX|nr:hypothetical protein CEXT_44541 [Caerostris extrusa]